MIIDGKKISAEIIARLKSLPGPDKILAAILVGSTGPSATSSGPSGSPQAEQSKSFLRQKENMAKELGISFQLFQFPESILEDDLILEIKKIGSDREIGGLIVQLPLPPHFDRDKILAAINPKQDIDAMALASQESVNPLPVEVVKDVLKFAGEEMKNKSVAVIGRGFLVGKPIMEWLDKIGVKYVLFHSKSDLSEIKKADLIISGVGKGGLIKPEMLKPGAGVIDFGYDMVNGKIKGDFAVSKVNSQMSNVAFYTPTPGGTGPILVAEIFKNFYKLSNIFRAN